MSETGTKDQNQLPAGKKGQKSLNKAKEESESGSEMVEETKDVKDNMNISGQNLRDEYVKF